MLNVPSGLFFGIGECREVGEHWFLFYAFISEPLVIERLLVVVNYHIKRSTNILFNLCLVPYAWFFSPVHCTIVSYDTQSARREKDIDWCVVWDRIPATIQRILILAPIEAVKLASLLHMINFFRGFDVLWRKELLHICIAALIQRILGIFRFTIIKRVKANIPTKVPWIIERFVITCCERHHKLLLVRIISMRLFNQLSVCAD